MRNKFFLSIALMAVTLLSSCGMIEGIFKTGLYVWGFIIVVGILLVIWILRAFTKR